MTTRHGMTAVAAMCLAAWSSPTALAQYVPPDPPGDSFQTKDKDHDRTNERDRIIIERHDLERDRYLHRDVDVHVDDRFQVRDRQFDRDDYRRDMYTVDASTGDLHRASRLIGATIEDSRGRNLGQIENFVIDANQGRVAYVVVSYDGRLTPMPWEAVSIRRTSGDRAMVRLNISEDTLRTAPTIRRGDMVMLGDTTWSRRIDDHYRLQYRGDFERRDMDFDRRQMDRRDFNRQMDRRDVDIRFRDTDAQWRDRDVDVQWRDTDRDFRRDSDMYYRDRQMYRDTTQDRFGEHTDPYLRDPWEGQRDNSSGARRGTQWDRHDWDTTLQHRDDTTWRNPGDKNHFDKDRHGDVRFEHRSTDRDVTMRMDRDHTYAKKMISADDLLSATIENRRGERLGDVNDLVIDSNGRVEFVVLSSGGFLGLGQRLHAVPFQTANLQRTDRDRQIVVLDVDRDRLRNAPSFNRGDWEDFLTDRRQMSDVYAFYDVRDTQRIYAYEPARRDTTIRTRISSDDVESALRSWPSSAQRAAREMIQRFGQPDDISGNTLIWHNHGFRLSASAGTGGR